MGTFKTATLGVIPYITSKLTVVGIVFLFYFGLSTQLHAEELLVPDSLIEYSPDFKFKEGIYLTFSDVQRNHPIPKGRIITSVNYNSNDFFEQILSKPKVYFADNLGGEIAVSSEKLWGYSRNGFLYVRVDNGFYRITLIGSCSHFVAYKTYEVRNSAYPYYSANPYAYQNSSVSTQTEMQQYLLDFQDGRMLEYEVEGVEVILMNDPELYDEYMELSNKKKKQLKFVFIRKYNERNPLYLIKTK